MEAGRLLLIRPMQLGMSVSRLSGDHGLSQKFTVGALKHIVKNVYVLRPEICP